MKAIRRDFGEGPARLGAVRAPALLKNVPAVPTACLFLVVAADRVRPRDAPRLSRGGPCAQRGAVHVHRSIRIWATCLARRHDPYVLHGASFEHARRVYLSPQTAPADIHAAIPQDIEVPASAQPTVHVGRLRYLTR